MKPRDTDDAEHAARIAALRAAVDVGIADIKRGAYKEFVTMRALKTYLEGISQEIVGDQETRRGKLDSMASACCHPPACRKATLVVRRGDRDSRTAARVWL